MQVSSIKFISLGKFDNKTLKAGLKPESSGLQEEGGSTGGNDGFLPKFLPKEELEEELEISWLKNEFGFENKLLGDE